ncbi:hypothetical protein ABIE53_000914 [Burkholderia sp. OAS925]
MGKSRLPAVFKSRFPHVHRFSHTSQRTGDDPADHSGRLFHVSLLSDDRHSARRAAGLRPRRPRLQRRARGRGDQRAVPGDAGVAAARRPFRRHARAEAHRVDRLARMWRERRSVAAGRVVRTLAGGESRAARLQPARARIRREPVRHRRDSLGDRPRGHEQQMRGSSHGTALPRMARSRSARRSAWRSSGRSVSRRSAFW